MGFWRQGQGVSPGQAAAHPVAVKEKYTSEWMQVGSQVSCSLGQSVLVIFI